MKISDLISKLQSYQQEFGDIEVGIGTNNERGVFEIRPLSSNCIAFGKQGLIISDYE